MGKSDDALRARLQVDTKIKAASSFSDRAIAEDAVSGALTANRVAVERFLKSGDKGLRFEQEFDQVVGRTLLRGEAQPQNVNKVRIWLRKDTSPLGYHVRTAYPVP